MEENDDFGGMKPAKYSFGGVSGVRWEGRGRAVLLDHSFQEGFAAVRWGWDSVAFSGRGEGLAVACADDSAGQGGEVVSERGGGSEGADVATGDLEGVEEAACLYGIDLAGGDGGKEPGDGELDGFGVFERREAVGGGSDELGRILAVLQ